MAEIVKTDTQTLLSIALKAAVDAGKAILKIYQQDFEVEFKSDESPLTIADTRSNQVIMEYLIKTGIPIISEENKEISFALRKTWDSFWLVDPLDGTKEFVKRNGEFTVNIALIHQESPVAGVIFVPCTRELYYGDVQEGKASKIVLNAHLDLPENLFEAATLIQPMLRTKGQIRVVGSRSHMSEETTTYIENLKKFYDHIEIVSKGSSLKFCLVAEGIADIYPRFGPTMEWDTAAGQAICEAVGLKVNSCDTLKSLTYNKRNLLNSYFIVE
ncbi:MAG: 3'(2'),5'-bisphosphate nucleotidase CysQ [Bacteroidia bacterium]